MKKPSLSKRIADYLERKQVWVHSGEIERLAMEAGFKSSNAGRRCREMVTGKLSDGRTCPIVLERKEDKKCVWYKHINVIMEETPKVAPKIEINSQGLPVAVY